MNRLREYRRERMLTQRELARKARVSERTIFSIEAGRRCRLNTQRKLLVALGLDYNARNSVFPRGPECDP